MKKRMFKKICVSVCALLLMFSFTAMTGCGTTAKKNSSSTYVDTYKVACCPGAMAYMSRTSATAKQGNISVTGCEHVSYGTWQKLTGGFYVRDTATGRDGAALWKDNAKTTIGFELYYK